MGGDKATELRLDTPWLVSKPIPKHGLFKKALLLSLLEEGTLYGLYSMEIEPLNHCNRLVS